LITVFERRAIIGEGFSALRAELALVGARITTDLGVREAIRSEIESASTEQPTDSTKLRQSLTYLASQIRLPRPLTAEITTEPSLAVANVERLALEAIADAIAPPPPVDYLAWAEKNIVFSERESPSFPGPYNRNFFPTSTRSSAHPTTPAGS
jgi:hypothetical protein